jgi:mannitol/fructose-specific phosphotransferase system IIA component (Ntr-type)
MVDAVAVNISKVKIDFMKVDNDVEITWIVDHDGDNVDEQQIISYLQYNIIQYDGLKTLFNFTTGELVKTIIEIGHI